MYLRNIFAAVFQKPNLKMKIILLALFTILSIIVNAQVPQNLWFMNWNEGSNSTGVIVKSNPDSCGFSEVYNFSTAYPSSGTDGAFCEAADGNLYGIIPRGKNEGGMISKFNPTTNEYSIVYFFDGCDFGRVGYPNSELTSGSDYKLYGVTWAGGLNNAGIIFSFDLINNTLTKLHDFDIVDGGFPVSKLLLTQDDKLYGMTSKGGDFNLGVIFRYDINTNSYSKILDFNSDNGASPVRNSLTQASNGDLYGMTFQGGINNLGVIFSVNPNTDSYTKHFDFSFSNAKYPRANLIEANDGNLYGMAQGGANNSGVIFQFNPITNGYTLKYSLPATFNNPQNSLIQASDGKLYGTGMLNLFSFDYNTSNYSSLFDFALPNGSILTNEAGYYPNTLIQASNGKMYGNTTSGGSSTLGTFFCFDIGNNSFSKIFDYSSGNNGFLPNQRLAEASNGKLYGTCISGGQFALGTIFCLDPVTHNLETVFNFNDTLGAQPQGSLITGNDGKLYGMTTYGGGSNAAGVIFSLDPINNAYNILFNFNNLPYLAGRPQGSLIQASNGLLYAMAQWNSAGNDFGNIFSFDPITNQYAELFVFDVINGAYPYGSLMEASNGLLYGTTSMGGESGLYCNGTLFSFSTQNNSFTKLVDFETALGFACLPEGNAGLGPRGNLVQASDGKLYGTAGQGFGSGKLFSYDTQSNEVISLYNFELADSLPVFSANWPDWIDYSLTIGSDGNLYGQTFAIGGGVCNNSFIYRFNPVTNEFKKLYEYRVGNIPLTISETISACQAYTWNGTTYTQSGTYTWTGTNAAGCDSVVTLNLTITPQPEQPQIACWQTANFNTSTCSWDVTGTQPAQPTNLACWQTTNFDTIICSWDVIGSPAPELITNASACVNYTWEANGETYSASGQYSFNSNCQDYTLELIINQPSAETVNASIAQGESYSFNGQNLITAGTYTATLQNAAGCDSTVTLYLSVLPTSPTGCYAASVVDFAQGLNSDGLPVEQARSNSTLALGEPETVVEGIVNFASLGFGGSITLAFEAPIANGDGADIRIDEATWGNNPCNRYPETADVFASQDGINFVYLGRNCQDMSLDLGPLSWAQYIRIVDVSDALLFRGVSDGYDVNGIECLNGTATVTTNDGLIACSLQEIVSYESGNRKNGTPIAISRRNPINALGMPQNNNTINFVALGFGGVLEARFDYVVFNQPGNELRVTETSFGNPSCNNYPEKARVSVSLDGNTWTELGEICQDGELDLGTLPYAQYIRIQDASPMSSNKFNGSADGFDVDAVVVLNNGCGNSSARLAQMDNTTTPDASLMVSAFPNPMEDYTIVNFEGLENDSEFNFQIVDAAGRVIRNNSIRISTANPTYLFDASELARGIYQVIIANENGSNIIRLVK